MHKWDPKNASNMVSCTAFKFIIQIVGCYIDVEQRRVIWKMCISKYASKKNENVAPYTHTYTHTYTYIYTKLMSGYYINPNGLIGLTMQYNKISKNLAKILHQEQDRQKLMLVPNFDGFVELNVITQHPLFKGMSTHKIKSAALFSRTFSGNRRFELKKINGNTCIAKTRRKQIE